MPGKAVISMSSSIENGEKADWLIFGSTPAYPVKMSETKLLPGCIVFTTYMPKNKRIAWKRFANEYKIKRLNVAEDGALHVLLE
mgnify:CR=1 FL=1